MQKKETANGLEGDELDLVKRFRLNNYSGEGDAKEFQKALSEYAHHRYGGEMIIKKNYSLEPHSTMDEIFAELKEDQEMVESAKDKKLLESLEQYYLGSEIYGVLG